MSDEDKINQVLQYIASTDEDDWIVNRCRTETDKQRNCVLGHIFNMGGNDEKACGEWWSWFEDSVASEFMIFSVNDGLNPKYQQSTPKQRCMAYIKDIRDGKEKSTWQLMDEYISESSSIA